MSAVLEEQRPHTSGNLLEVRDLKVHFPIRGGLFSRTVGYVHAVDGVSFDIRPGETMGLVGESGCGKTTTGRAVLRLVEPTAGSVYFEGQDLLRLNKTQMRAMRREMQIIFQDPFGSLNPRMSVGEIIEEPLAIHKIGNGHERQERVRHLLEVVGLASYHMRRFPHEFSGGQRQRVGIARALALNPKLIVADEPVSALDVSIQSQILNLLEQLQAEFKLTYLFIAHGLNVIRHISDRVGVMYLGVMVETANASDLYRKPLHPYTEALFSAIPIPNPAMRRERIILTGDVPSPVNPPSGCRFHTRCPIAQDVCKVEVPLLHEAGEGHLVACHFR
ncbi:MAG: dipeptide ABC transporter ATP-binding protein [Firmicutes bacterium]|jgi:oligopeptide/dipeptide ABC transporter ATP-binding protein|nr:dipeptide ABC transporter ATP-binding protein [Bacillota bacterium]